MAVSTAPVVSTPQLMERKQSIELFDLNESILTEDDMLHYRRLSYGGQETPSDTSSNSSCEDDDPLFLDIILAQRPHLNISSVNEQASSPYNETSTSFPAPLPANISNSFPAIPGKVNVDDANDVIYFPTGWSLPKLQAKCQETNQVAVTDTVNGHDVNIYPSVDGTVYCSEQRCPHLGGPLYNGEIEEIPETGQTCIVCPWHKYCFDLQTGHVKRPRHRPEALKVYPTRVEPHSELISIGFESFHRSCFSDDDF